ncbi:SH2 domain-containing protein 2A isoform X2 [Manis javanica]|uniref:SH2 domain-containing protein 2A isoform X2 n=1 Tax=Manis javanica TaxID=9974 RepID=UPI003C6DB588
MELPLAQICPQGNQEAPAPAFCTFQPVGLSRRSCQGLSLLPGSRLQALQPEAQPSPRSLGVPTVTGPQVPGAASSPEDSGKAEEVPREGGQALQATTRAWFQKTQAPWLLQHGAAPAWFHGFITRREAERLLETKPQGCYLVRFSESAVTFVLTYRSRTCCRHFLLAQLGDGRHVVLGEDSAHTRLQDLLRHYTASPLSPYGETLTEPLARQTPEPSGLSLRTEESDSGNQSQDPLPQYSPIIKKEQTAASKEAARKPKEEPEEPIAFYAMGRGSPGDAPSNIYAEVEAEELAGAEGLPGIPRHQVLRKCWSRPTPGGQNLGGWQVHAKNSVAGQGSPVPHQHLPLLGHTLPCNLSRQVLQDRGQTWLPLGPPQ